MRSVVLICCGVLFLTAGYMSGHGTVKAASYKTMHGVVPKSYGRLVTAIADSIGTGIIFEDENGVIRFVSVTGMKEGQLARY